LVAVQRVLRDLGLEAEILDDPRDAIAEQEARSNLEEEVAVLPTALLREHVVGERRIPAHGRVVAAAVGPSGRECAESAQKDEGESSRGHEFRVARGVFLGGIAKGGSLS